MKTYEYQVSESANADRQYFTDFKEAMLEARLLSKRQKEPVYVDVYDVDEEDMADFYYTVTDGNRETHK